MINDFYRPPKSLSDSLVYPREKSKKIAILLGIMRWAFNSESITRNGAHFVQRALKIRHYQLHKFYTTKYMGREFRNGEVLERDDALDDNASLPAGIWEEILKCIKITGGKELHPGYISNDDVKTVLIGFWKWLRTVDGMEASVKTLSFGGLVDEADGESYIRFKTKDGEEIFFDVYEESRNKKFTLNRTRDFNCSGCEGMYPCVYEHPNGQSLCACCAEQLDGNTANDDHPCYHVECTMTDCENAQANRVDYTEASLDRDLPAPKHPIRRMLR